MVVRLGCIPSSLLEKPLKLPLKPNSLTAFSSMPWMLLSLLLGGLRRTGRFQGYCGEQSAGRVVKRMNVEKRNNGGGGLSIKADPT